ncbi:MAG: Vps62-related protein [Gammaproteobacteria bacterium]
MNIVKDRHVVPLFLVFLLVIMIIGHTIAADPAGISGKVIAVDGNRVTIKISPGNSPNNGDRVELSFNLAGERFHVGTWRVKRIEGTTVMADVVKAELPADVDMDARIFSGSAVATASSNQKQSQQKQQESNASSVEDELFWLKSDNQSVQKPAQVPAKATPAIKEKSVSKKPKPIQEQKPIQKSKLASVRVRIQHIITNQYQMVWKDSGSGARKDFASFRPVASNGYYPLADVAVAGPWKGKRYASPEFNTLLVKSGELELKKPVGYEKIWSSKGSNSDKPFSSWGPIAPAGYRCLGDVGSQSLDKMPSTDAIRCIPEQCAQETQIGERIWRDKGSGADIDFSVWLVPSVNLYIGNPSHGNPRITVYTINPSCLAK